MDEATKFEHAIRDLSAKILFKLAEKLEVEGVQESDNARKLSVQQNFGIFF
tara:strand:+ start:620 stop:772 length:153 start_codon:yes stop_codon:yes gene_type:complete